MSFRNAQVLLQYQRLLQILIQIIYQKYHLHSIDDDMKSNGSKQFNKICELYLKLSGKSKISSNDYKAILEVVKEQWNTNLVLKWIEDCFRQFKPQHKNDQIRSFRYVTNYIF